MAAGLDGVNFSTRNLWGGTSEANKYYWGKKVGRQFILDGVNLETIGDDSYDFLLSCNNLEHIANPIKALLEWERVLKKGGILLLILPRKESNFDHNRPITTIQHLRDDFAAGIGEDDLTHLDEILKLHDLKKDPLAGCKENFLKRGKDNMKFRALHHHVYDIPLLRQLMEETGIKTLLTHSSPMDHFLAAKK